jgi:hypothetical protein
MEPSKEQIEFWIKKYVPDKDYFFVAERDLVTFEPYLTNVLIIPRSEFFQHASYIQIQLVNSFEYWNLSKEVQYVMVASPDWCTSLPSNLIKELFSIQVKMGRGLILPVPATVSIASIPEGYLVEEKHLVIQSEMWRLLPYELKETVLLDYAFRWDNWNAYEFPEHTPLHLRNFANTFPSDAGSNCLSATLFAISGQEWMIKEWVHQQTFEQGLNHAQYYKTEHKELAAGDVVTWENEEGIIIHAAYHISDQLIFNKNGQTSLTRGKL